MKLKDLLDLVYTYHINLIIVEQKKSDPLLDITGLTARHINKYGDLQVIGLDSVIETSKPDMLYHSFNVRPILKVICLWEDK